MVSQVAVGQRIRRLRHVAGLGQEEFAKLLGIASGSVSKLETGQMHPSSELLDRVASLLKCTPGFLAMPLEMPATTRPWLRAYADAPKRTVDLMVDDCTTAMEAIIGLSLRTLPDSMPLFTGDLDDPIAIEEFATDVRVAAGLSELGVVGNAIRAAERLGCIVLPMPDEIGRHLGISVRANQSNAIICLGRYDSEGSPVPGDRQRFTLAHEIGHLSLHAANGAPMTAAEAGLIEKQAHFFAGAFLAPGDAILADLQKSGGRVTLQTLTRLKQRWGLSIKAFVARCQNLGVIDANHARSLYKQISARGWNRSEPVQVDAERAVWFDQAIKSVSIGSRDPVTTAAQRIGLDRSHFNRWLDWTAPEMKPADIVRPAFARRTVVEDDSGSEDQSHADIRLFRPRRDALLRGG